VQSLHESFNFLCKDFFPEIIVSTANQLFQLLDTMVPLSRQEARACRIRIAIVITAIP
jgi:hypothetical protein